MNTFIKKLLSSRRIEYLTVDQDFNILDTSSDVQQFSDCPNEVILGTDVRLGFPELIGLEDILIDILEGRQTSFDLKCIARSSAQNSPLLYIDIYVIGYESENSLENRLIILIEEVTERMTLEQTLVQRVNETNLLMSTLAASRDYIHKIITSMADALLVTTKSGKIKTVNRAAQNLFGYSEAELIGKSISTIIYDQNLLVQATQQNPLSQGELLKNVELVCYTKTEKKITVAFSCSVIQTEIEDLQNFVYIGRDITERKRIQQRLAVQYSTNRVLLESATLEQATPKILQAICESLEWDLGQIWAPEQYPEVSEPEQGHSTPTLLQCVETWVRPSVIIPELTNLTKHTTVAPGVGLPGRVWTKRSHHWITDVVNDPNFEPSEFASQAGLHSALGFPILDVGAKHSPLLGVMTFFSREVQPPNKDQIQIMATIGGQLGQFIKRKQAEEKLKNSEERYRDLFENANDLIQCVTYDGRFVYVNRAWRNTLGYSEAELAKMTVFDVIHPNCQPHCLEVFQRVMSGEKIDQLETQFVTKDGQTISLEGNINCKFVDGKPVVTRAIFRNITQRLQTEAALRHQQEQTEGLLLNILPSPIANRLKDRPGTIADNFTEVTVMFADIVGFTELSARNSPTALVRLLNVIFSEFDQLAELHDLEKIKTIGDAYMVVGGLPVPQRNHAQAIAQMALDMQAAIAAFCNKTGKALSIRIGINTGPVVAGVIGIKKFSYDLWGDTVNIASRMESHGLAGQIQVTAATYQRLRKQYLFEQRGVIDVKGKGEMRTYLLIGRKGV